MRSTKKKNNKSLALLVSVILILTVSLAGTLAYLVSPQQVVTNSFVAGNVPNSVEETINGNVKNDVMIKNDSNIDAYVRAAVVISWVNDKGEVYGNAPVESKDYEIDWTMDKWIKGSDGYYYYTKPVAAGTMTDVLFTNCKVKDEANVPNGYNLSVEIMGQTIQALGGEDGKLAVQLAWPNVSVNADGSLSVK